MYLSEKNKKNVRNVFYVPHTGRGIEIVGVNSYVKTESDEEGHVINVLYLYNRPIAKTNGINVWFRTCGLFNYDTFRWLDAIGAPSTEKELKAYKAYSEYVLYNKSVKEILKGYAL